jgi:hypothetical protein
VASHLRGREHEKAITHRMPYRLAESSRISTNYAFGLGALEHYAANADGHSIATNSLTTFRAQKWRFRHILLCVRAPATAAAIDNTGLHSEPRLEGAAPKTRD